MTYPTIFRNTPDQAFTTYSYADMVTGKAFIKFYGTTMSGSQILSVDRLDSDTTIRSDTTGGSGGVDTKRIDDDFDLKFTRATIIEGDVLINLTHGLKGRTNDAVSSYVIVRARKVLSGSESDLTTFQSETLSNADQTAQYNRFCAKLTIPRTKFKRNDILRFTVEVYINGSFNPQPIIFYAADPNARAILAEEAFSAAIALPTGKGSTMEVVVPFNPLR